MLPQIIYLYPENTQVLLVQGLQDVVTGLYLNLAYVTATLYDPRGDPDPVLQNLQLNYLPGTNGNYQGTIPASFNPPKFAGLSKSGYILQISASQAGINSLWSLPVILTLRSKQ
jgi:hypothetical protein